MRVVVCVCVRLWLFVRAHVFLCLCLPAASRIMELSRRRHIRFSIVSQLDEILKTNIRMSEGFHENV